MKTLYSVTFLFFAAALLAGLPGGAAPGAAWAANTEGAYTAFGRGSDRCAYVAAALGATSGKKQSDKGAENPLEALADALGGKKSAEDIVLDSRQIQDWLTGYFTAAGLYNDTRKALGDVGNIDGILRGIRSYCRRFPSGDLADAADHTAKRMLRRAGLRERGIAPLAVLDAVEDGDLERVYSLIAKGADVDEADTDGLTALHAAAGGGEREIVGALIAAKADVNAADADGTTALMRAAAFGDSKIVIALISAGADIRRKDNRGRTALDFAEKEKNFGVAAILKAVAAEK